MRSTNTDGDGNDQIGSLVDDQHDLRHVYYAEPSDEIGEDLPITQTQSVSSVNQGIALNFEGANHDGNINLRTATRHPYDPILIDEVESTTDSWRYGVMDFRINLDQTSLPERDHFEAMKGTLDGLFQTEFDTFMAID